MQPSNKINGYGIIETKHTTAEVSHSIGHRRCLANIKTPRFHYQYPVLTSSMSPITHLPNELIPSIADHLDYSPDINHLSQTCRHLYNILNPYLYARNVCLLRGRGLWRAVELGSEFAVLKLVVHGANKDQWTQGTPERRQREKEERRWKRRNLKGVKRYFYSSESDSSFPDEFYSHSSRSGPASNDDDEEEEEESSVTESSESGSESGLEFWQRPVSDSDSDDSQAGKYCTPPLSKEQRKALKGSRAARHPKPPLNGQSRYKNEPPKPLVYLAAYKGNNRIVNILIEHGAHPNACAKFNTTPLMAATDRGNVELVRLLLQKGVPLNSCSGTGERVLGISTQFKDPEMMTVLPAHDQTQYGETIGELIDPTRQFAQVKLLKALRYGIKGQHIGIVRMLLDKGVLSRARKEGSYRGLLELAAKIGNETIISMLEEERKSEHAS